jgi:hypothetical protein
MGPLVAVLLVALAGRGDQDPKRSEEADARVASLRQAIAQEVARLGDGDSWAGSYYQGDGLGVNVTLDLAPAAGFVFEWHGCMGLYDRNFGAVNLDGDHVHLIPELPNTRKGFEGTPLDFNLVRWGKRRYLIPSDAMLGFCNAVNAGYEPRKGLHGGFLLRREGESQSVSGPPELPQDYVGCLLHGPIAARVVAVGPSLLRPSVADFKFRVTAVTLDAGSAEGVWEGMEFHLIAPKGRYETAIVKHLYEHESEAEIEEVGTDDPPPAVGWRLATRLPR